MDEGFWHQPVLLQETVHYLAVRPGGVYIDCTVGEGGHASAVLQAAMPGGRLLGIDLDPAALAGARRRLSLYEGSYTEAGGSYSQLRDIAFALDFVGVDGVLMDLGLSSLQLQASGRGFSFQSDEPLDMRFDPDGSVTAGHIVNSYPADQLASILFRFGGRAQVPGHRQGDHPGQAHPDYTPAGRAGRGGVGRAQGQGPSGHPNLPSATHCRQRRAGQPPGGSRAGHGRPQARGQAGGHQLSQPGGPHRKGDHGKGSPRLHLPSPCSGMRLRPRGLPEAGIKEGGHSIPGGGPGQSQE